MTFVKTIQEPNKPISFNETLNEIGTFFGRYGPLFAYATSLAKIVASITLKVIETVGSSYAILSKSANKMSFISLLIVPLKVHNIVRICQGEDKVYRKATNVLIEFGSIFNSAIPVTSWVVHNIKNVSHVLPYLVGISTVFQVIDLFKKSMNLIRTQNAASKLSDNCQFKLFFEKIKNKQLDANDKHLLEVAFKFNPKEIDAFCEDVEKLDNQEKVRSHLKDRVDRALVSHTVQLVASVIETIASIIILAILFVAPPLGVILSIVNASLLGSSVITKITLFVYDKITEGMKLKVPKEVSLQIVAT